MYAWLSTRSSDQMGNGGMPIYKEEIKLKADFDPHN